MVLVVNCYNPVSELVGLVHGFKHFYWIFFTQLYMLSVSSSGPQTGKKDMDTEANSQTLYEVLCENTSAMKAKHYVSSGDVWKTYCICHHPLRPIKQRQSKWSPGEKMSLVTSSLRALALNPVLFQNLNLACLGYSSSSGNMVKAVIITHYVALMTIWLDFNSVSLLILN